MMRTHPRRSGVSFFLAGALALAALPGCSSSGDPSSGSYVVTFPSTAAAVATDSVVVLVFDVPVQQLGTFCQDVVRKRRNKEDLPRAIAETAQITPCDLNGGKGPLSVSYGTRAVLAVGSRGGQDFLIGCAVQEVAEGSQPVPVDITLVNQMVTVPQTSCVKFTDHCAGKC